MFISRKLLAGGLALVNTVGFFFAPQVLAAGPSPIAVTVTNTTLASYSLVTCTDTQNIRPLGDDYGRLSSSAREFLPAKTLINPETTSTHYSHVETDILSVHLINLGFVLTGTDEDCGLPAVYTTEFAVENKLLDLLVDANGLGLNERVPGTLRVRNYLDSPFILVVCDKQFEGAVVATSTVRIGATQTYELYQDSAVYVVPDTLVMEAGTCAQLVEPAYQVIYYNYRPDSVTTRTIAGFEVTQTTPEVKIAAPDLLPQDFDIETPSGRTVRVDEERIVIETETTQVEVENVPVAASKPVIEEVVLAPKFVLIRTGGRD